MSEGMALLLRGVSPQALDAALKDFGFPVGPVTLMDEVSSPPRPTLRAFSCRLTLPSSKVGVDVSYHTSKTMLAALGERMAGGSPAVMEEMLASKFLGRKTGKGFFVYEEKGKGGSGKAKPLNAEAQAILTKHQVSGSGGSAAISAEDMQQRMILRFVKECIHCAEDGILLAGAQAANPKAAYAAGDIGAVYGIGFPPFWGGPFRYCDLVGTRKVADKMQQLADTLGPQFKPPQLLLDLARDGKTFH
jgi:enoyl-CoA hydratase / long-chain 3-hydroxyacyl-CoA dehydrogenase